MCIVSLTDRKHREVLFSRVGIQSVADVVRRGRLRWFGHLERESGDKGCRSVEMWRGWGEMSWQAQEDWDRACE